MHLGSTTSQCAAAPAPATRSERLLLQLDAGTVEALLASSSPPPHRFTLATTSDRAPAELRTDYLLAVLPSGAAPTFIVPGGLAQSFSPGRGVRVHVHVEGATQCSGQPLEFSWALQPPVPGLDAGTLSFQDLVVPAKVLSRSGITSLNATLTLRYSGGDQYSSATVQLAAAQQPLVPVITGSAGDVYTGDTIRLSAAQSYDPDLPADATAGLSYSWECISEDYPAPCFAPQQAVARPLMDASSLTMQLLPWDGNSALSWSSSGSSARRRLSEESSEGAAAQSSLLDDARWSYTQEELLMTEQLWSNMKMPRFIDIQPAFAAPDLQSAEVSFPAAALAALDRQYTFRLTVAKGSRVAQAEVVVTPRGQLVAQASLVRRCTTSPCPARHPRSQPLVLELQGDAGVLLTSISVAGHSIGMDAPARAITLRPEVLPAHLDQLVISADLSQSGRADGRTQLVVRLDSPPRCGLPGQTGCMLGTASTTPFPRHNFVISMFGVVDDSASPLVYHIGRFDEKTRAKFTGATGQQSSLILAGAPPGSSGVFTCAYDSFQQRSCFAMAGPVGAPAPGFDAAAELQGFRPGLALGTPVSLIPGKTLTFLSLVQLALSDAASSGAQEPPAELEASIRDAATELLRRLAAQVAADDPERSSVAALSIAAMVNDLHGLLDGQTKFAVLGGMLRGGLGAWHCVVALLAKPNFLPAGCCAQLHSTSCSWNRTLQPCAHHHISLPLLQPSGA